MNELTHHGIKGQRWGVRRYQNKDGSRTPAGKERYGSQNKTSTNTESNATNSTKSFVEKNSSKSYSEVGMDPETQQLIAETAIVTTFFASMYAANKINAKVWANKQMKDLEKSAERSGYDDVDQLPKLKSKKSPKENMKEVNPDYPDEGSTMNCTFCTSAMALREKGYDVKAGKRLEGEPSDKLFMKAFNSPTHKMPRNTNQQKMMDELASNGEGSYGNLTVFWKGGGGHSVFWKNENGKTHIYDGQSGEEYTKSQFDLDRFTKYVNMRKVEYNRLDNCEPTKYALGVIEPKNK